MKPVRFIKFMPWMHFQSESRDRREISAVRELGWDVTVICHEPEESLTEQYPEYRFLADGLTEHPAGMGKAKWLFTAAKQRLNLLRLLRRQGADLVSCHDLRILRLGWLATLGMPKGKRPLLVYDSHEFELGRHCDRTPAQTRRVARWEKFLMKRCAFSTMVNDSIADQVQRIHGLRKRPVVVRSTPENWVLDKARIAETRAAFLKELGLPAETFLAMYHGGVIPGRGIENAMAAVAGTQGTAMVVLGDGDPAYLDSLRKLSRDLGIENRLLLHPAEPLSELYRYVGAADVGLILIPPAAKSYYYMLPNKFFECIQSMTPVMVSDFPEVGRLTKEYGVGLCVDPEDVDACGAAIRRMKEDKALYESCKAGLARAKENLCWENEKTVLQEAYRRAVEERLNGKGLEE